MGQNVEELKAIVLKKRATLEENLQQAISKAQNRAAGTKEEIRKKLAELDHQLKDGWENLTESAASKINEWLK